MKFLWLTDIPTPYRNHSFERMAAIFPEMGIELEVVFMALRSKRRPWTFEEADLRFPHRAFRGAHPFVGGAELHVNPELLLHLRLHPPDVALIGGWASPTHLAAPWCLPPETIRILGCESNLESVSRRSSAASWVKARTIDRYDAFLVPQRRSLDLIRSLSPNAASKPHLLFPNIVDGRLFRRGVEAARAYPRRREELGVSERDQLWVCSARLAPEKGLEEFLPLLEGVSNVKLVIAGDGPLRRRLETLARERGLSVRFIGQQTEAEMIKLYAAADLFVLPSLRDPSPLSVVEACAAAVPLLVSNRIGNVDDVLINEENGFLYDANMPMTNAGLIARISRTPRAALASMGRRSVRLYDERFDSDVCVSRLGAALVELQRSLQ